MILYYDVIHIQSCSAHRLLPPSFPSRTQHHPPFLVDGLRGDAGEYIFFENITNNIWRQKFVSDILQVMLHVQQS